MFSKKVMPPKINKRGNLNNLKQFKQKEQNVAKEIVEFAETTHWDEVQEMTKNSENERLVSDVDFTKTKNVIDHYINMASKGYTLLRLSEEVMPVLTMEQILEAKAKYENHESLTGIFTDHEYDMYVAKKNANVNIEMEYEDENLFKRSTGFSDPLRKNPLPEDMIWLLTESVDEDDVVKKFNSATNKELYPTKDEWPLRNTDAHKDRKMIVQKE